MYPGKVYNNKLPLFKKLRYNAKIIIDWLAGI